MLAIVALFAGCVETAEPTEQEIEDEELEMPCPGHWHVTMLVADGTEVLPFFSSPEDQDDATPVSGIHMHQDDGMLHLHPGTRTCFSLPQVFLAVGIAYEDGVLDVDGEARAGAVRVDVQPWGEAWATWQIDAANQTVPDGARILLMVNPPGADDVDMLREQVPTLPEWYAPK